MTSNQFERAASFIQTHVVVDEPGKLDHFRFAAAVKLHQKRKARARLIAASSALTLTAIAIVVATNRPVRESVTFQIDGALQNGNVGSYVSAPPERSIGLHFSEGSKVVFSPSSRGRIAGTTPKGATLVLEDGHARADIIHRQDTQWQVFAGPYVVGVTGTSFDVGFNNATQTFELNMHAGSVRVTGPGLKNPIEIRDQQRISLSLRNRNATEGTAAARDSANSEPGVKAGSIASSSCVPASATAPPLLPPQPRTSQTREIKSVNDNSTASLPTTAQERHLVPATESFSQLGTKGLHARIIEQAERFDVDQVTATVSAGELLALGNAARFMGKTAIALKAYGALRDRFAGAADSAAAAFFLGRLTEPTNPGASMQWYEKYLAEAPNGVFIPDASGRHLVLLNQVRGKEAALEPARDYLERFPSGPYAGFARKILSF